MNEVDLGPREYMASVICTTVTITAWSLKSGRSGVKVSSKPLDDWAVSSRERWYVRNSTQLLTRDRGTDPLSRKNEGMYPRRKVGGLTESTPSVSQEYRG